MNRLTSTVRLRAATGTGRRRSRRLPPAGGRSALRGLLYALPALTLYALVVIIPFTAAVGLVVIDYNILHGATRFVGLKNFAYVLFEYEPFGRALGNSLVFVLVVVSCQVTLGFVAALVLANRFPGCETFRTLVFLPWVVPGTITAMTWKMLYHSTLGPVHALLEFLGLAGSGTVLGVPSTAMPAVMVMQVWSHLPLTIMILMAGVQSVPIELHESAIMDGCNAVQRTIRVTLPFMRTTFFVCLVLTSIWTFKAFEIVYLTTGGGPDFATLLIGVLVYQMGFQYFQLSVGSAMGVVMLVILLVPILAYTRIVLQQRAR